MENIKYILFYALLIIIAVMGYLQFHWLIIFPATVCLAIAYIVVKGKSWKQVMGKTELSTGVVLIAVLFSQIITSAIFYGVGRVIAHFIG